MRWTVNILGLLLVASASLASAAEPAPLPREIDLAEAFRVELGCKSQIERQRLSLRER